MSDKNERAEENDFPDDIFDGLPDPNEIPDISFEAKAIIGLSINELKRLKKALLKADSELEDLYLAIKLHEVIQSYPF